MDQHDHTHSLRDVPAVSRIAAFRESRKMAADPISVFHRHMQALGPDYYYYFGGMKPVLVTQNPVLLRHILKDNHENYRKSEIQVRRMGYFLGHGLLTSHGEEWLRMRRLIQKAFAPHALEFLSAGMNDSIDESLARFRPLAAAGPVDLAREMMEITFTMVARSLFGARMTVDEIGEISEAIVAIQAFIVRQIVQPYLIPWFALSGETGRHQTLRRRGDAILLRHIRERRRQPAPAGSDLLQILLDTTDPDTGDSLTDEQVLCESMQLLVAGHETSANALTWTLYLLGRHPDRLVASRAEFERVVGTERLALHHLTDLPYNTRIVEESMRIFPPFWMVDRVAVEDDRAGNIVVPAGTTVIAFFYGAHHAPSNWQDPELFVPDRIGPTDRKTTRDFTYLPFGGGPRTCIGAGYAMLQMLMIMNVFLRAFDFRIADGQELKPGPKIILRPRDGAMANVTAISGVGP